MKLGFLCPCFWHVSARWSTHSSPWQTSMELSLRFGSDPRWTVIRSECDEMADCNISGQDVQMKWCNRHVIGLFILFCCMNDPPLDHSSWSAILKPSFKPWNLSCVQFVILATPIMHFLCVNTSLPPTEKFRPIESFSITGIKKKNPTYNLTESCHKPECLSKIMKKHNRWPRGTLQKDAKKERI